MLHAYSSLYLDKSSRTLGNMLHDAVIGKRSIVGIPTSNSRS